MTDAADSPYSSSSSLATPRPSADAADEPSSPAAPIFQTLSEIMYASHGRSLKALAVLSLGLKNNDGSPTFDPSVLPWSAALRPSALIYAKEKQPKSTRIVVTKILNVKLFSSCTTSHSCWPLPMPLSNHIKQFSSWKYR